MAVQFEAIQSATAFKETDPRIQRPVQVTDDPGRSGIFSRCFNVVLYYGVSEGRHDSGWHFTWWIKESLGRAFAEHPLLCGRLRRRREDGGGEGSFELVSNDSGARLIEASIDTKLEEFLGSKGREDGECVLVYWKDIDEKDPQFSPLFYIQVTTFQCGGYSIGLSCSLLVADPIEITGMIKRWAVIHAELLHPGDDPKDDALQKRAYSSKPPTPLACSPCKKLVHTVTFAVADAEGMSPEALAWLCAKEAEKELGAKIGLLGNCFPVMARDVGSGAISVNMASDHEEYRHERLRLIGRVDWGTSFGDGIAFRKGDVARAVSCWVGSPDGFVMVTPLGNGGEGGGTRVNVLVAIPRAE